MNRHSIEDEPLAAKLEHAGLRKYEKEQWEAVKQRIGFMPTRRVYIQRLGTGELTRKPHKHTSYEEEDLEGRRATRATFFKRVMSNWGVVEKHVPVVPTWELKAPPAEEEYDVPDPIEEYLERYDAEEPDLRPARVWQYPPPEGNGSTGSIRWRLSSQPPGDPKAYDKILEAAGLLEPPVISLPREAAKANRRCVY